MPYKYFACSWLIINRCELLTLTAKPTFYTIIFVVNILEGFCRGCFAKLDRTHHGRRFEDTAEGNGIAVMAVTGVKGGELDCWLTASWFGKISGTRGTRRAGWDRGFPPIRHEAGEWMGHPAGSGLKNRPIVDA